MDLSKRKFHQVKKDVVVEEPKLEERLGLVVPEAVHSKTLKDYVYIARTEGYYKMLAELDSDIFDSFKTGTPVAHQARALKLLRTTWFERLKRHTNYIMKPCRRCNK